MFYKKQAIEDFQKTYKKINIEQFGIVILVWIAYYFGDISIAIIISLVSIIWTLCEIQKLLNYQNLMKEKEISLHEPD